MSEVKLLPCPFCGGGAFLDECRERWDVSCDKCGASTDSAMDAYEAEELWNTRIASDALAEMVKALEWYREQTRLCRLIHREGDEGRNNLAADGGKRADEALQKIAALDAAGGDTND